jgi:hypothetical protein
LDGLVCVVVGGRSLELLEIAMTERCVGAEQPRRLEREVFRLEVTRAGKRFWRERSHDDLVFAVATSVWVAERLCERKTPCRSVGSAILEC